MKRLFQTISNTFLYKENHVSIVSGLFVTPDLHEIWGRIPRKSTLFHLGNVRSTSINCGNLDVASSLCVSEIDIRPDTGRTGQGHSNQR